MKVTKAETTEKPAFKPYEVRILVENAADEGELKQLIRTLESINGKDAFLYFRIAHLFRSVYPK